MVHQHFMLAPSLTVAENVVYEDTPAGMRQKVEILTALRRGAELLVLDEPTGLVEASVQEDMGILQNGTHNSQDLKQEQRKG